MESRIHRDVVIVGAGHAGAELACVLRKRGFAGSILLTSDEPVAPYERPPLSKAYLLGKIKIERLLIREQPFWEVQNIELVLGCSVTTVDAGGSTLRLSDGRVVSYDWCVLATGGKVRRLAETGARLPGVHYLRTLADADNISRALEEAEHLVIIGAGFIGLEVAAAARELGKHVAVVEAQERVLARVTSPIVSEFYEGVHRRRGVEFEFRRRVAAIEGNARVEAVILDNGKALPADLVVAGIGIDAETSLAESAGLQCEAGVIVDGACRTSVCNILAIGDCSRHPNDFAGGLWRLESVQHANGSASVAADTIMGIPGVYREVPTFWSEQYHLRLQTAGLSGRADEIVTRGDRDEGPFSVVYLRQGKIVAIDAINAPKDFVGAGALIRNGVSPDRVRLADVTVALKTLA